MRGNARRRRAAGLAVVALLAAGAGLAGHFSGLSGAVERSTVDARFSLRGRERTPPNVVIVGLDDNSLGDLPRYPFSRRLHARVIDNLHAAGARLIVYDVSFDRPTDAGADEALFEAAARAAPVVFSTTLISPSGHTQVLGGNANLASIGARAAAAELLPDGDGVLRHTLDQVSGLSTVAAVVGRMIVGEHFRARQLRNGWIDFPGPPGTVRSLSFVQVLRGRFDPAAVRGKIVIVGATAALLQDLHATAAGSPMSGPEVQADAITTALNGFPLRSPSQLVTVLVIVLLALPVPLSAMRLGTLGAGAAGLGVLALWSAATQLAFDSGAVLDYSDPLSSLVLATAGTIVLELRADSRERRRLRMLFADGATEVVARVLGDGTGAGAGAHASRERTLEPTAIIAGYRIEQAIGQGGMGIVYRARQLSLERDVAIKLIAAERSQDPIFRERFKLESRIAASIEHANVIPVYEAGEDDGLLFIAMRLVEGVDLARLLARTQPLEAARIARIIAQLAGALDAAHARGLVHRDVKPANVLITFEEPEHVYLTDFGVAKHVGASAGITRVGQWVGTLDYLAPEQIQGERLDGRADIYALTGLLYECLTGETPYPRDNAPAKLWAHINAPPPAPSHLKGDLPEAVDEVIARGMAKDPQRRFDEAAALAESFARAIGLSSEVIGDEAAALDRHEQPDAPASAFEPTRPAD